MAPWPTTPDGCGISKGVAQKVPNLAGNSPPACGIDAYGGSLGDEQFALSNRMYRCVPHVKPRAVYRAHDWPGGPEARFLRACRDATRVT